MLKTFWKSYRKYIEASSDVVMKGILWIPAGMAGLISYDVFSRYLLNRPCLFSDEINAYMLILLCFMGAAGTLKEGKHISVDVITMRLRRKTQRGLELITYIVSLLFLSAFWVDSVLMVYKSYVRGVTVSSFLETPLWIPQIFIPIGILLLLLQLVADIGKSIEKIISGRTIAGPGRV